MLIAETVRKAKSFRAILSQTDKNLDAFTNAFKTKCCLCRFKFLANLEFLAKLYSFIVKCGYEPGYKPGYEPGYEPRFVPRFEPKLATDFELIMSSGESLILLFPNVAIKIFSPTDLAKTKIRNELTYSKMFRPYVVEVIDSMVQNGIAVIAYEKVLPLTRYVLQNLKRKELLLLITQVGYALDVIMSMGYEHGDPGHTNIGFSPRLKRFVLLDLEDIKPIKGITDNRDIKMFLEDLEIQIADLEVDPQVYFVVQQLVSQLAEWYKFDEEEVTFLGRKMKRANIVSSYQPGDLSCFIQAKIEDYSA